METKFTTLLADILQMEADDIKLEDKFREYDNWDSLSHLSVIVMMDEEFQTQIETKDLIKMTTVADLINAIKQK